MRKRSSSHLREKGDGMPIKDPEARREYNRQWHQAHKESEYEKSKKWHQENREASNASKSKYVASLRDLINERKKAGACTRCGIADWRVLEWHHVDPSQKRFNLNMAWKKHVGKEAIFEEMAKCELICANCHRILHWEEHNGS
jgi:hypothetical protein